jgi:putative DNA methylase
MPRPTVLIETWLPIEAIGAEAKREHSTGLHPPPNRLHVWWARRPLIASRAAILAGVLPAWSPDFPADLRRRFPNEASYRGWFLGLCGIQGDPAQAQKLLQWAKQQGTSIPNPYDGPRAFTVNPTAEDLAILGDLLEWAWGTRQLSVLDPFAGGGSIPFEALRYGFTTIANDLNPVAAVILKATLDYPARFGP